MEQNYSNSSGSLNSWKVCTNSVDYEKKSKTNVECESKCDVKQTADSAEWIKLNVGGKIFMTTRSTLRKFPDSFLYRLCERNSDLPSKTDEDGAFLIDRDPEYFTPVLNFLRHGNLILNKNQVEEGLLEEAEFYCIKTLVSLVKSKIMERDERLADKNLNKRVYRVLQCEKAELTQTISTLSDGWRLEQKIHERQKMTALAEIDMLECIPDVIGLSDLLENTDGCAQLNENTANVLTRIVCSSIYNHKPCHKPLISELLKKLGTCYEETVIELFFDLLCQNKKGICNSRLCSYSLEYMNTLLMVSSERIMKSAYFDDVVDLYAVFSNEMGKSTKYKFRATKKLFFVWRKIPNSFTAFLNSVCSFKCDLKYLFLVGALEEFAMEKRVGFQSLVEYTVNVLTSCLTKSLPVSEETLQPCESAVMNLDYAAFERMLPECSRCLLRCPRGSLILHLISKDEEIQNLAQECFLFMLAKCVDPQTHQSLVKYLFGVLDGALGAVSLFPQRKAVFTVIGNLKPPVKIYDHTFLFVLQRLLLFAFDKTSAESSRICVFEQLIKWCLQTVFSREFFDNLLSSIKVPGISSLIYCLSVLVFKAVYSKDQKYVADSELPTVLFDFIKKDTPHHVTNAEHMGALLASFDLLTQIALDFPNDNRFANVWTLFTAKEALFHTNAFLIHCPPICFPSVLAIYLRILSYGTVHFNAANWSQLLICCLYRMDRNERKKACAKLSTELNQNQFAVLLWAIYNCVNTSEIRSTFNQRDVYMDVIKNLLHISLIPGTKDLAIAISLACSSLCFFGEDASLYQFLNGRLKTFCKRANKNIVAEYCSEILDALLLDDTMNEAQKHAVMFLSQFDQEHFGNHALKQSISHLSQPRVINVSESDFMIMNTPAGELYDKAFIDSLVKVDVEEKNIKRESKAYSYKEQLAELELKRELEKSGKLKKTKPSLTKKQQELVNQKMEEEATIRKNALEIKSTCAKYFSVLISYIKGSGSCVYSHYYTILKIIGLHAPSLISGNFALEAFLTLQGHVKLKSDDLVFSWISFRTIANPDLIPDNWKAEDLKVAKSRALSTLLDLYQRCNMVSIRNFAFFWELLSSVIINGNSNEEIAIALDVISNFFEAASTEKPEVYFVEKPCLDTLKVCIYAIQNMTNPSLMNKCTITAKKASQVCLQYSSNLDTTLVDAIVFLLSSLEIPVVAVHEACLTCLWELKNGFSRLSADMKLPFSKYIWIAMHSEIEFIRETAEIFWQQFKCDDTDELLQSVLPYVPSSESFINEAATAAVIRTISLAPNLVHKSCQYLINEYDRYVKPFPDEKNGFGRISAESDRWANRTAIGYCLNEMAGLITANEVPMMLQFFVDVAFSDHNPAVQDQMLKAAISLVDRHSKDQLAYMLKYFDEFLANTPKGAEYDNARLSVVILMGVLARELNEGNPKIKPIMGQLIMTLNTPSEMVQKAVANCLSPLVSSIKDEAPKFVEQLVSVLLKSDNYAERRGAAYGIAGIVKGLGIFSLKSLNLMDILQAAVQNKEHPIQREGALLAFEMLMQILGRVFEIYIVRILPDMLQCFSDNNIHVRNAANECGKVIMSNLTAHGVKLILPSLMDGIVSDMWRTKCGSVDLLGSMAFCAPNQLSICLPNIVPKLIDILNDSHTKVQRSGLQALKQIGSVIKNPEIRAFVPQLIDALQDPSANTQSSLQLLADTNFIHHMDAASLALIIPVIRRGLQDRSIETRKLSGSVLTKICSLTSDVDLDPYLEDLLDDLKKRLMDPVPQIRKVSAQALGSVVKAMGHALGNELITWLKENLNTNSNPVDRSGAAQGLCEIAGAMDINILSSYMDEFIPISQSQTSDPYAKSGSLIFFHFVAGSFPNLFSQYIPKVILAVLKGIADEFEYVRDAAYTVGQSIVNDFSDKATILLLPELELYIFDENWRIRSSSLSLLCDLLLKITGTAHGMSEGSHSDKSLNMLGNLLGSQHRNKILSEIYMARNDNVLSIAQNALRIWKIFVSNTPKTLREILSTLLYIVISQLASPDKAIRKIAGLTLGDAVRKLGESTLVEVLAIIKDELKSENIDRRRAICYGLNEIIAFSSKDYLIAMFDSFAEILLALFLDDNADVRAAAASAFAEFVNVLGTNRINDYLLPELVQKIFSDARALDSLLKIIEILGGTILTHVLPPLLSNPNAEISVIYAICNVGGDFVARYLKLLISSAVSCLEKSNCSIENLEKCGDMLVAVSNEGSFPTVCSELISYAYVCLKDENYEKLSCILTLIAQFVKIFPSVHTDSAAEFMKLAVKMALLSDENVLEISWTCIDNYVKRFSGADHIVLLTVFVQSLRSIKYEYPNVTLIPGFCLSGKGIKHVIPLYREGIVNGNPNDMEMALSSLHQLILYVSAEALQPSVMTVSGFLIRVLGERFSVNIKSLVLIILIEMLNKVGESLRLFSPQLQHTFLRGLSSSNRKIRFLSACALKALSKLKLRIDVICTTIMKKLEEAPPEEMYTDTYLFAFMSVVTENPNRLPPELMRDVIAFVLNTINDESLCALSGGVYGAIYVSADKDEASKFLMELPGKIENNSDTAKQGLYVALYTLIQYRPQLAVEHFEMLKTLIISAQCRNATAISYSILRCLAYLIKAQLSTGSISDIEPFTVFCEQLQRGSTQHKLITLSFLHLFGTIGIPDAWLKTFLTSLVLGTQDRKFSVKQIYDKLLAEFLNNPANESKVENAKPLLNKTCSNVLSDFCSNSLSRILNAKDYKPFSPNIVDLDETILTE